MTPVFWIMGRIFFGYNEGISTKSNRMLIRTVMFSKNKVSKLLRVHVHVHQFVHHSLLDYHFWRGYFRSGVACVTNVIKPGS